MEAVLLALVIVCRGGFITFHSTPHITVSFNRHYNNYFINVVENCELFFLNLKPVPLFLVIFGLMMARLIVPSVVVRRQVACNAHQKSDFVPSQRSSFCASLRHLYLALLTLTHSSWHVCVDVASRTIRLNTSLFWASLLTSVGLICSHFFMSSVHLLVGRPFLLLPSSLASNMCLSRESCLFRWPKYDSFLAFMLFNNQSWPTFSSFRISVCKGRLGAPLTGQQ